MDNGMRSTSFDTANKCSFESTTMWPLEEIFKVTKVNLTSTVLCFWVKNKLCRIFNLNFTKTTVSTCSIGGLEDSELTTNSLYHKGFIGCISNMTIDENYFVDIVAQSERAINIQTCI